MNRRSLRIGTATAVLLMGAGVLFAQDSSAPPTLDKEKQQQQRQQSQQNNGTTLTLDSGSPTAAPVASEEDTAIKAVTSMPEGSPANLQAKLAAAEDFLKKYPESRYRVIVYPFLTIGYVQAGQSEKALAFGDKELEINPNDVATMAVMSQTMSRVYNAGAPDAAKRLDKAESLGKRAVEVIPTIAKPEGITDEAFINSKNQTLAMAHSGIGLVEWRRGKFADAIPELEQSIKLDPITDPVNWFILGIVNQNTAHFDDAANAFTKCSLIAGQLADTCKGRAEAAKKLAATKLSTPK
ncbi:MAG: tetratricopeptide repeat protein [Acidobacteria bacterium]|nr:tetratricopeptide repeat protein [Acidobacteriota bacterium]MBS1866037.1 tetratricopeptide repeat protein [Acidobacteriota bacterium]